MQQLILRDYQSKVLADEAAEHAAGHRRTLVVCPTGSGKSVLISSATMAALESTDRQVFITAPRRELVTQLSGTLQRYGIDHGYIATGHEYAPNKRVYICGIDALRSRISRGQIDTSAVGRVLVDEASHSVARTWYETLNAFDSEAWISGYTATPERLDGRGLGDLYTAMTLGPSPRELIERGALSKYVAYCPSFPDLHGVARGAKGDYAPGALAERMLRPGLTGNAVEQYKRICDGALAIGFAVNVAHAAHLADAFCRAGVPAAYVDGTMSIVQRAQTMRAFADGHIRVLFSSQLLSEGVDVAALAGRDVQVKAVLLLAPTQSLANHIQRCGRAMRPSSDGEPSFILDYAGCIMNANGDINLGFPDDHHAWSLNGMAKRAARDQEALPPPPVRCGDCYTTYRRPAPDTCTDCGAALITPPHIPKPTKGELAAVKAEEARLRALEKSIAAEVKADLQAIADEAHKAEMRLRAGRIRAAKTLEDLEALGKEWGHKPFWAIARWEARRSKKSTGYTGHGTQRSLH